MIIEPSTTEAPGTIFSGTLRPRILGKQDSASAQDAKPSGARAQFIGKDAKPAQAAFPWRVIKAWTGGLHV